CIEPPLQNSAGASKRGKVPASQPKLGEQTPKQLQTSPKPKFKEPGQAKRAQQPRRASQAARLDARNAPIAAVTRVEKLHQAPPAHLRRRGACMPHAPSADPSRKKGHSVPRR
ncbi:hypothetical protein IscW_ISCW022858, partial [Ixodes scapularis]